MSEYPVELGKTEHPVLMWARHDEVEQMALDQLRNVGNLPWVEGVRVMPDVHYGKGATVGSVIAMRNAVSPSAVGVDIGCGMAAVRMNITESHLPDDLHGLRLAIEAAVPVGFNSYDKGNSPLVENTSLADRALAKRYVQMAFTFGDLRAPSIADRFGRALSQCGTLGGGNHFIELCADEDGQLWITLHSGSRNIGKELAERHIAKAKLLEHNAFLTGEARDLAVFLSGSPEMDDYLHDLYWAQDYALLNRHIMLATVQRVVTEWWESRASGSEDFSGTRYPFLKFEDPIQSHHNYVAEETHDGVDVIVTRKGAIRAGKGDLGIIPGSMATGSYIVEGLGNPLSYESASHGAGRKMSRGAAKRQFTNADVLSQTAGVECRKDDGVIDELPAAYKRIEDVIEAQVDLIEPKHRLRTLLCVKG